MSSLLHKICYFFRLGRLPENLKRDLLSRENIVFRVEGIPAWVIFRNFKSPSVRCSYRCMLFFSFIAMTERRFIARAGSWNKIDIQIEYDDPRFKQIRFYETKNHLCLRYDAADFMPNSSGQVEIKFALSRISDAAMVLKNKGASFSHQNNT
jgi:hypothetical protein